MSHCRSDFTKRIGRRSSLCYFVGREILCALEGHTGIGDGINNAKCKMLFCQCLQMRKCKGDEGIFFCSESENIFKVRKIFLRGMEEKYFLSVGKGMRYARFQRREKLSKELSTLRKKCFPLGEEFRK